MSVARRCDLHLLPLEGLVGRSTTILFPDGWYGRPQDDVLAVADVEAARDPVRIAVRDVGHLLVARDCAVLAIRSELVAIRIGTGVTRCFRGETTRYEAGFVSFVMDEALDPPFVGLHFFMSGTLAA